MAETESISFLLRNHSHLSMLGKNLRSGAKTWRRNLAPAYVQEDLTLLDTSPRPPRRHVRHVTLFVIPNSSSSYSWVFFNHPSRLEKYV